MRSLSLSDYLLLGALSLVTVSLLTPIMRYVARRYGVVDAPS